MSHFFAYLSRMKFIERWGLMRNAVPENIQEHSLQVAMVAHALAVIRNRKFGGDVDASRVALLALYHDCSEVITGDMATPIKSFNPAIREEYKKIENLAAERIHRMLPEEFREDYRPFFFPAAADKEAWELVHAADRLCAYLKCIEELEAGNKDFKKAKRAVKASLTRLKLPEVDYFVEVFTTSFALTLDELN